MNIGQIKIWRDQYADLLKNAADAAASRLPFLPYSDELSSYSEEDIAEGGRQFNRLLNSPFVFDRETELRSPGTWIGSEVSPYGFPLGITYRKGDFSELVRRGRRATKQWERIGPELRAAVLCEALDRLHRATFLFAHVGMHTSGHGFFMGFHANAIHAQARALESISAIWSIQRQLNKDVSTQFVVGDGPVQTIVRSFRTKPVGLSVVYAGRVVPTWGAYPAIFASLAAGCATVVIPHDNAVLPIALTIRIIKSVCQDVGLSRDIVSAFVADDDRQKREAALHPSVKVIDYMGKSEFGEWLLQHALRAKVFIQSSSFTPVFVHSTKDYNGLVSNLAFGLCSYSGQLCTSPQTIYVMGDGIVTDEEIVPIARFKRDLVDKLNELLNQPERARELLGALVDPESGDNIRRLSSGEYGEVLRYSEVVPDADYPKARVATPLVLDVKMIGDDKASAHRSEISGPVSFILEMKNIDEVIYDLRKAAVHHGYLGVALFTIERGVERAFGNLAAEVGALLTVNFTKNFYISQYAIFSDLHGSGANPSSNVIYGSPAYFYERLRLTEVRKILV